MKYPVKVIGVTQSYHQGKCIDLGHLKEEPNPPVYADDNGFIYRIEKQTYGGNVVYIKHDTGIISQYAHLDTIKVKKNQNVIMGEIIGTMGKTGASTNAVHLHYGLFSKNANIHGNSDLDPFHYCQVYDDGRVGNGSLCKDKILYAPDNPDLFIKGDYTLLDSKALRKSPKIADNIAKVYEIPSIMKKYLTSQNKYDKAYLKRGTDIIIREIIKDKAGRTWGKISNFYVVLIDKAGVKQAFRIK